MGPVRTLVAMALASMNGVIMASLLTRTAIEQAAAPPGGIYPRVVVVSGARYSVINRLNASRTERAKRRSCVTTITVLLCIENLIFVLEPGMRAR